MTAFVLQGHKCDKQTIEESADCVNVVVQAPRPLISFVNATDSSIYVTWTSGETPLITQCRIRYKRLNAESWTEVRNCLKISLFCFDEVVKYLLARVHR